MYWVSGIFQRILVIYILLVLMRCVCVSWLRLTFLMLGKAYLIWKIGQLIVDKREFVLAFTGTFTNNVRIFWEENEPQRPPKFTPQPFPLGPFYLSLCRPFKFVYQFSFWYKQSVPSYKKYLNQCSSLHFI